MDDEREDNANELIYECCDCHGRYQNQGPGQCPHCGNWGARYAGEPDESNPVVVTDGGRTTEDYVDLGTLAGDGGREPETVIVERDDLEEVRTSLMLAEQLLGYDDVDLKQNGRGRITEAIRNLDEMLKEDGQ